MNDLRLVHCSIRDLEAPSEKCSEMQRTLATKLDMTNETWLAVEGTELALDSFVRKSSIAWFALPLAVWAGVSVSRRGNAEGNDLKEVNERCAIRLSAALLGHGTTAEFAANPNPQLYVDTVLNDARFIDRFARFLNASFNRVPGASSQEDAAYHLGKYVLEHNEPYKSLFVGPFNVDADDKGNVAVTDNPEGLGYFRSLPWMYRYAGNEGSGLKLVTAYRIFNNTVGLELVATTADPNADVSVTTRDTNPTCRGCHFEGWSALDLAARVLTRKKVVDGKVQFIPPDSGPQLVADRTVSNDKELVTALVESENFRFNACRLAFKFLYGRTENACESNVFDACVDAFTATGKIQSAIASIAKDPSFCQ